jgi:hypothetical protein
MLAQRYQGCAGDLPSQASKQRKVWINLDCSGRVSHSHTHIGCLAVLWKACLQMSHWIESAACGVSIRVWISVEDGGRDKPGRVECDPMSETCYPTSSTALVLLTAFDLSCDAAPPAAFLALRSRLC